jgi:hypothetical protein
MENLTETRKIAWEKKVAAYDYPCDDCPFFSKAEIHVFSTQFQDQHPVIWMEKVDITQHPCYPKCAYFRECNK